LLAPFSPLIRRDLRDSFVKYDMETLSKRPVFLQSKNKTRLNVKGKKSEKGEEKQ
jgi:hypothetical protein